MILVEEDLNMSISISELSRQDTPDDPLQVQNLNTFNNTLSISPAPELFSEEEKGDRVVNIGDTSDKLPLQKTSSLNYKTLKTKLKAKS